MLTNLNWLSEGERFPPLPEKRRLDMYRNNKELFESEHAEIYREDLKRIERVINNFQDVISYPVVLNFQKLMSLKVADLLFGEPPSISAKDVRKQLAIDTIMDNSKLLDQAYQAAIDASRYGDGLFYVHKKGDHGVIDLTQPCIWYPIVSEDNIKDRTAEVLAWKVGEDRLKVSIHYQGRYEEREYQCENGNIGKLTKAPVDMQTGLTDFAVVQVSNTLTSDRVTGIDDYTDVDSIIADIMVRIGQIDRILDKHANPSLSGPKSALEQDPVSHEYKLVLGSYFIRDNEASADVKYLTWDGQLAANFTQLEKLINLLYTISEMGSALFGDMTGSTGQVASGTALKRLMVSPLAKVARLRAKMDTALKTAIVLCSQLGGKDIVKLDYADISIKWQDGLPADDTETAAILTQRLAGKASMSQKRALVVYDGLSEEEAEEELLTIQEEENLANPMSGIPTVGDNTGPDDEVPPPMEQVKPNGTMAGE